jgi:hypothetical protein
VSCDLRSVIPDNTPITVSGVLAQAPKDNNKPPTKPADYNGTKIVDHIDKNYVYVKVDPDESQPQKYYHSDGSIEADCPPATAETNKDSGGSVTVTFGVTAIPGDTANIYLSNNAFFANSSNLSFDSNGMLSSSDSSSTQQITAILNELAQTIGQFGLGLKDVLVSDVTGAFDARQACFSAIAKKLKSGPLILVSKYGNIDEAIDTSSDTTTKTTVSLDFELNPYGPAEIRERDLFTKVPILLNNKNKEIRTHSGLAAFFPKPHKASVFCSVDHTDLVTKTTTNEQVFLSAPSVVNLYSHRRFVDPQRDFLTSPQDTFTFSGGFLIGHKYTDQSAAKTIVDTVIGPIRSLIPSVSVQQTNQVQSSGGKVTSTTTSTQTTTTPAKSQ